MTDPNSESPPTPSTSGTPTPAAEQAIADLVTRLGLTDPSAISVESVDEVTWRNGSLGCPAKGMQYTQVLTPGTRIVLIHDGTTYEYHAGGGRDPFYCATPEAPLD